LQTPRTSEAFAGRGVHVPRVAGSEQLRHEPPQASLQQTPSTQKPDPQSDAFVQTPPGCLGPQLWFTHAIPAVQSASVAHEGLQAAETQRYGVQSATPGALHVPRPSQVPGVFKRSPAHDGSTHTVCGA
jgi:hypothetical protein